MLLYLYIIILSFFIMNTFNSHISEINDFWESLLKDLPFKLIISWYIQENDNFVNQEFFLNKENVNEIYITNILEEVRVKLEEFKNIKNALKNEINLSEIEKKFLLQVLNTSWFELVRFKNSIYLEAEKAWLQITKEDRKKYSKRSNTIQRVLHWIKVSDNPFEINEIFNKLESIYINYNEKLSPEEIEIFSSFFKDFNRDLPNQISTSEILKDENIEDDNEGENQNIIKSNLILKKTISIDNVKKIFDLLIELYWLDWWKSDIWNYLNFGVSKDYKLIKIPKKKKNITIKKLLELIDHEISIHAIRWYNTNETTKKNYPHYVEAEEWFAKLSTYLLYDNLENIKIEPSISLISTLIAENYDWEKTYEILKIYFKLRSKKWDSIELIEQKARDRMLRIKKFLSLNEKWAAWKDVSYFRWEEQIQDHLLKEDDIKWFIKNFYFSKLSLKDLEIVDNFKELLEYEENKLIYPLWIWKILLNKLIWEKIFLKDLKEKDLRFKAINNLRFWVKKKIVEILNIINK